MDVLLSILPIFFIFLIFYFLVIRPQTKAENKRREFIRNLKKGDIVYTSGGIVGKIYELSDRTVTLETSKDVRLRVLKETIQGPYIEKSSEQDQQKEKNK